MLTFQVTLICWFWQLFSTINWHKTPLIWDSITPAYKTSGYLIKFTLVLIGFLDIFIGTN
jgi:hypothetical protein